MTADTFDDQLHVNPDVCTHPRTIDVTSYDSEGRSELCADCGATVEPGDSPWTEYSLMSPVRARRVEEDTPVTVDEDAVTLVNAGDYLVTDAQGRQWGIPAVIFELFYRPSGGDSR